MTERDRLIELLRAAGIEPKFVEPLAHFGVLLLETNRRFNLTGAATPEELAPHIVDSLSVVPFVRGPLADVGSGGGLPAIPVAIATGISVTLIESTTKKAAFLESLLAQLDLPGRVIPERAELAGRHTDLREQFACATARGVASAPTALELTLPFVRLGGTAVLQRGKMDERERNAVRDAAPMLGAVAAEEVSLADNRRLIIVRKQSATPERFPRRVGIPEKRPLCL
jgi:16S rRNA (guanine527-N7)-methyltransferase